MLNFLSQHWHTLLIIVSVFAVGAASPGPATLMILNTAIIQGRRQALALALSLGVISGSMIWATVAAFGSVATIETSTNLFVIMKFAAGLYLLYLSAKSFFSALSPSSMFDPPSSTSQSIKQQSLRGLLIHLTNPKAPLVWLATF